MDERGADSTLPAPNSATRPQDPSKAQTRSTNLAVTRLGWTVIGLTVFIAIAGFNTGNNLIYLLDSVLIAGLIVSAVAGFASLKGITVTRRIREGISAGDAARVKVILRNSNTKRRSAYGIYVEDELKGKTKIVGRCFAAEIPGGQEVRTEYIFCPNSRGIWRLGPTILGSSFPAGLFERRVQCPNDQEVIVYPRMGRIHAELLARCQRRWGRGEGTAGSGRKGGADEFYGLRDYQAGDNPHHIYWRSTAKWPKLLLKEFERYAAMTACVVLDTFAEAPEELDRFELAVSFAASAMNVFTRAGWAVTLILFSTAPRKLVNEAAGRISRRLLRELALVQASQGTVPSSAETLIAEHARGGMLAVALSKNSQLRSVQDIRARAEVVDVSAVDFRRLFTFVPNAASGPARKEEAS